MTRAVLRGWRAARRCRACRGDERGFTLIESVIALGLLCTVVLGLLGALTTGVKGVVTGRQRTVATSIGNQVVEQARARAYGEVGLGTTSSDPTLATDTSLVTTGTTFAYNGEPIAASSLPGANAPFNPHIWTTKDAGTTYTARVYVTWAPTPALGDRYKRITVFVSWQNAQTVTKQVKLSSLLYEAVQPPDPLLRGNADSDAGWISVGGLSIGPDVQSAQQWFGYTHGEVDSQFIKKSKGFGITPHSEIVMKSGSVSIEYGSCTAGSGKATCPGAKAATIADNDEGTEPKENDPASGSPVPVTDGQSKMDSNSIDLASGGGSAVSGSTARSDFTIASIGDNDGLPYHSSMAGGPNGFYTSLASGSITGKLANASSACAASDRCSMSTVDVDKVGTDTQITSFAQAQMPAIDFVALDSSLISLGMVRVGATNMSATASAGPNAPVPTLNAAPVTVQMFSTVLSSVTDTVGYKSFSFTPGIAASFSTHADLTVLGYGVTVDATVRSFPGATSYTTAGTAITHAEARFVSWMQIDIHLVINNGSGTDINLHVDYGRVSAVADYAPPA